MKQDANGRYKWYHKRVAAEAFREDIAHCRQLMEQRDLSYRIDDLVTLSNQTGLSIEDMLHRR